MTNERSRHAAEIVIVDDDPAVLGALKFALEAEGFGVEPYRSGSEVLAQHRLPQSGCMIIDFRLPDMNGLSLLASLRKRGVLLPAILITSHPSPSLRKSAAAADTPIIEKPLLGDALLDAIHGALSEVKVGSM